MLKICVLGLSLIALFIQGCAVNKPALPDPAPFLNKVDLRTDWRRGVDGGFGESSERFRLIVKDDSLFFSTSKGVVYELNRETGRRLNSADFDLDVSAGISLNGSTVYLGTYDAELLAVSIETGDVLWKKLLTSEILAEPSYAANKLAVQTSDGWLSVVDAGNGDTLWRIKEDLPTLTVRGTSAPIIYDGKVIAGFANGKLKAFGLLNGKEVWSYEVGRPEGRYDIERLTDIDGQLTIVEGIVYATAYNGTVTAINTTTGRPIWQRSIPSAVGVAIHDDLLAVVDLDSVVHVLNAKNGSEIWTNDRFKGRDLGTPTFLDKYLAIMDRGGYVYLLEPTKGQLVAQKLADQNLPSGSRMMSFDRQLFILTQREQVTALTY